jgi:hypothetical protein
MMIRFATSLVLAALFAPQVAAALIVIPMTSHEQFLRVDPADVATSAVVIALTANGLQPGQTIFIEPLGGFDNGPEGDAPRALMAVFSASATLLGPSLIARVPDAIDAGPDYVTHTTCPGNLPTDIPEDFTVPIGGTSVEIPAGATHLFLCPRECYSRDNSDPNGDFGARITLSTTGVSSTAAATSWLAAPRPNPMRTHCAISFSLAAAGRAAVTLCSVDGRRIRTLVDRMFDAGVHQVSWDGTDDRGIPVAAGVYLAHLVTGGAGLSRQLVVVK